VQKYFNILNRLGVSDSRVWRTDGQILSLL